VSFALAQAEEDIDACVLFISVIVWWKFVSAWYLLPF
jgi:hypothetical protein